MLRENPDLIIHHLQEIVQSCGPAVYPQAVPEQVLRTPFVSLNDKDRAYQNKLSGLKSLLFSFFPLAEPLFTAILGEASGITIPGSPALLNNKSFFKTLSH